MRVVLADDSVILREGLARLLREQGFEIVAQVGTAPELLAAVAKLEPHVAIVDIRMPPTHTDEGLVVAEELRTRYPAVGVLVLSQYVEPEYALRLLERGEQGAGYLLKDRVLDVTDLADAVRRIGEGGSVVDPALVAQLVQRPSANGGLAELTERECDVLALLAEGLSDKGIAQRLVVTPKTVETHVRHIFSKLDLPSGTAEEPPRARGPRVPARTLGSLDAVARVVHEGKIPWPTRGPNVGLTIGSTMPRGAASELEKRLQIEAARQSSSSSRRCARLGLSRRRSRVRVPSLPSLNKPHDSAAR